MTLPVKEHIPRMCCTDDRLKKLRTLGIDTDGYVYSLEQILTAKGFGLPSTDGECWGFTVNHKYSYIFINQADCLAEAIFALIEHGLWKQNEKEKK